MKIERLINSLNKSFTSKSLRPTLTNSLYNMMTETKLTYEDVQPYMRGPENEFSKITLIMNEHYNLYLIRWGPNHSLPRHSHIHTRCMYKLVEGELEEILYKKHSGIESKSILGKGEVCYIDDEMGEHSVSNKKNDYSYSVHLYYEK